ncbi:zinc finger BED domain-containing protein 1-like [Aphis craccivora]|uniref:Zinc finger BED domain-containing protein 1-like n=1 Tax=Aphis craccivora TaxID=307492 RepID=A0A6G0YBD2_APHCR|nr:zinc finger BED domain-containing protein 1-like [Aphis craccivora]
MYNLKPLKQLGEHMSAEKVVTASGLWPVYFRLENNLLRTDSSSFTCSLSQISQEAACSIDLFSTETECDILTIDFGTKDSNFR